MSDASQGPGWWQASDGKWYPPEQAPAASPSPAGGASSGGSVDVAAALGYGWNKFVKYIGQIIIIVLVIVGVQIVFQIIGSVLSGRDSAFAWFASFVVSIAGWLISLVLAAGIVRAALAITRGDEPSASMLFETDNIGSYIIASILVSLLTLVGLLALCVGALVVIVFTYFYPFYVLDRGDAPVASISNSFQLVKDNLGGVLVFLIVATVLNLITCGLALGVTLIAGAWVYRTLNGEPVAA